MNQPPEILRPADPDEHLVPLFSDTRVVVVAVDPENDPLAFVWFGPTGAALLSTERQDGELTTSTAEVPYDDAWIGQSIEVLVIDQSDLHNDVSVEFEVVEPW